MLREKVAISSYMVTTWVKRYAEKRVAISSYMVTSRRILLVREKKKRGIQRTTEEGSRLITVLPE
jgi:transposase